MGKPILHIIKERLWSDSSEENQNRYLQVLVISVISLIISLYSLIYQLVVSSTIDCFLCNLAVVLTISLATVCIINRRFNCVLYIVFTIPLFIYAYFISDFSPHEPLIDTVYFSVWWFVAGLLFLLYFAESDSIIIIYYIISILTISFQLLKADRLFDSFSMYNPSVTHPLLVYSFFFFITFIIRLKYKSIILKLTYKIKSINHSITRVIQDSQLSVVQIRVERDEDENVVNLWIERVNVAFESAFKISLHEVQDQEVGYIFNLLFRNYFDVNKMLILGDHKTREFHAKNLDRWFKFYILKPEFNKIYVIFEDITKTKQKIAELEEGKRRYKVLLEAIPDIFFVIDKDGTYEDFVIKESDLFKVDDVNIIGNNIYEVGFPDNMADKIYSCIQKSIKTNSIESIEYSLNTHNGTFMFEMRLAKLNAHSVISVARDITKRKTAEFNLEKALVKAQESDRLKSAFLANLSHEIRTPLNIITNFTRILAESEIEFQEKLELSDAINQNGQQLLNMIDNTIHLSKIETQSVDISLNFCSVNEILRDIYNKYRTILPDTKIIKISMNLDVPNPSFGFITDDKLLREIINILVDNAVKYTLKGEVVMGYEMIRNEAVKFTVSDTGIGIPEEERENIFSRFYRVKNKINDSTSGSGVGLPIAQHYVALLDGELEMESKPGIGTKFWFVLPFREGQGFLRVVS